MTLIMPIITFPYASRILAPEGIGAVNFANSNVEYFIMIAGLGIGTYATREAAKLRDNPVDYTKFAKEIFTLNLISTAAAYGLLFFCLFTLDSLRPYKILMIVRSIKIIMETIGMDWVFQSQEDFAYITVRKIIFQFVGLAYLFVFVRNKGDLIAYEVFGLITAVGSNTMNLLRVHKYVRWKEKTVLQLKAHLKPIFILFATSIAASVYNTLDKTMLGFLSGDVQVGYYTAATKINHMVLSIITVLNATLLPRLSYYAQNDRENYFKLVKKSSNYLQALSIPMAVGMIFLAGPITYIFCGQSYMDSVPAMIIISPIVFIIPLSGLFSNQILIPHRKDKYSLYPVIFAAAGNFVANMLLIPKYGAIGAAIGTLIAETLAVAVKIVLCHKTIGNLLFLFTRLWHYALASALMALALYATSKYFSIHITTLFVQIIAGALLYVALLLLLKNEYTHELTHTVFSKLQRRKNAKEEP